MSSTITIVHATRNRLKQMWIAYEWALRRARRPEDIEYILSFDEDDAALEVVRHEVESGNRTLCPTKVVVGPKSQGNNAAWNRAYHASSGESKVIVELSDDFECPAGWDVTILERFAKMPGGVDAPWVLGVADPHFTPPYSGDGLLTIFIATRAYCVKAGNFVLYPEYPSYFSDNDQTQKAAFDECLIDAYDLCFCHHWHGGTDDPLRDDTYSRHASTWHNDTGRWVYSDRCWQAFPDVYNTEPYDVAADYARREPYMPHGAPSRDADFASDIEGLGPPCADRAALWARRAHLGFTQIRNKPFPKGSWRRAWIEGDYRTARDGVEELVMRYHRRICGGRFRFHGGLHVWGECSRQLGDKPLDTFKD